MDLLGVIALLVGFKGVVLTARGLRGLFARRNAVEVIALIEPLERLDFRFSEGEFSLIVDRIYGDLVLSHGSILLLISLVLSFASSTWHAYVIWDTHLWWLMVVSAVFLGLFLGFCALWYLRKLAINAVAKEIEVRACKEIREQNHREKIENLLSNWFPRRVGRNPELDCAEEAE